MSNNTATAGGCFNPAADYTTTGNWTMGGNLTVTGTIIDTGSALASPVITGTVTGGASYTAPTLTSPAVSGALTASGTAAWVNTLTDASYAPSTHQDEIYSKITLTPPTVVTAANGLNAIRGEVNLTTGKTLGSGAASYVTGVYGRGNIAGTVDIGSGDLAAVYGKFDLNGGVLTSGHIAPVQANIVNPGASAATVGVSLFYGESASGTPIGNGIELYMAASYLMKLSNVSSSAYISTAAGNGGGGTLKKLKVSVDGTDLYLLAAATWT